MRLSARIAELESTGDHAGGGIVQMLPNESADVAIARATANGRSGGVLLIPAPLTADEWVQLAISQQAAMTSRS